MKTVWKTKEVTTPFEELAKDHGLKDTSLAILIENDYDSKEALATITEDDMAELKLTLGQSGLLKKWVATLTWAKPSRSSLLVQPQWQHRPPPSANRTLDNLSPQGDDSGTPTGNSAPVQGIHLPIAEQSKRKIRRPHEFFEGRKCAADLNFKEFYEAPLWTKVKRTV